MSGLSGSHVVVGLRRALLPRTVRKLCLPPGRVNFEAVPEPKRPRPEPGSKGGGEAARGVTLETVSAIAAPQYVLRSAGGWRTAHPGRAAAGNARGGHVLWQRLGVQAAEATQGVDHRHRRADQMRGTGVGAEFSLAENQATMMLARMPKTISQIRLVTM